MIEAGESILLIVRFFIQQIGKIFDILNRFEILPGISYFDLMLSIFVICILIKIIRFGYEDEIRQGVKDDFPVLNVGYKGKHTNDGYRPKHNKKLNKKRSRY